MNDRIASDPQVVPVRGLALSGLALVAAALVSFTWPDLIEEYAGFVWLLALVPVFLLAYYKGWKGAAVASAAAMSVFTATEALINPTFGDPVDWWFFGEVTVLTAVITVGTGWLSELLHRERRAAYRMAYEDPLTKLPTRRAVDFYLEREVEAARRGKDLSVVYFDVDGFKEFNDRYGHGRGDQLLSRLGATFMDETRASNVMGRYGGEEFLAILPGENVEGGYRFAERICEAAQRITPKDEMGCTLSAGVAEFAEGMSGAEELVERADLALYSVKRRGGQGVAVSEPRT